MCTHDAAAGSGGQQSSMVISGSKVEDLEPAFGEYDTIFPVLLFISNIYTESHREVCAYA
jgi:hypothetical protein